MSINNIKEIIDILPTLLIYLAPGYIILWIRNFILSNELKKDKQIVLKSVVLSYIVLNSLKFVFSFFCKNLDSVWFKITVFISTIIIGYCSSKIVHTKLWQDILGILNIRKSPYNSFWMDITEKESQIKKDNSDSGAWARVYIPEENIIYEGALIKIQDVKNRENNFLVFNQYIMYDYDQEEIVNYSESPENWVVVNSKNITRIEIFKAPNN